MRNKKIIVILIIILIAVGAVVLLNQNNSNETGYVKISPEDAKEIIDSNEDITIIDVRTEGEYEEGHVAGAVCIPNETISKEVSASLPDKDQEILVYCRSGNRSKQAADKLIALGYTNVKDFGGIIDWPYEVIN